MPHITPSKNIASSSLRLKTLDASLAYKYKYVAGNLDSRISSDVGLDTSAMAQIPPSPHAVARKIREMLMGM